MSTNNYEDWANQPVYNQIQVDAPSLRLPEMMELMNQIVQERRRNADNGSWFNYEQETTMPNQENNAGADREMTATERLQEEARRARERRLREDRMRGRPILANQPTVEELDRIFRANEIRPATPVQFPPPATAPTPGPWVIRDVDPRAPAVVVDDWEIDVSADPAYDAPAPPQEYQFGGEGDHFL